MIYENSRYMKAEVKDTDGIYIFKPRSKHTISSDGAKVHLFSAGDTLDGLANFYLGNPQLWWAILEMNPKYRSELEIPYGENLIIPSYHEVIKCLRY